MTASTGVMLHPKVNFAFFDRRFIKRRWHRFNADPLERAGHIVRLKARDSIKKRKLTTRTKKRVGSVAPRPPFSWAKGDPFRMIRSVPEWMRTKVVVGMVYFAGSHKEPVPGLQEHGGRARRRVMTTYRRQRSNGTFGSMGRKFQWKTVTYPERPFMWPALQATKARFPQFWQDSLK